MKSINKFLSNDEQIEKLKKAGLNFPDKESIEKFKVYLTEYNYEVLINGYWFKEFYEEDGKTFSKDITSNDIRYIFDIDRTISTIIWKYFKGIELHFNAIITDTLCKAFEKNLDGPYVILLDEESGKKIFGNYNRKNYNYIKTSLLRNAYRKKWFDSIEKYNLENENKNILKKINLVLKSTRLIKYEKRAIEEYHLIHLKALSSSWTFSQLKDIYKWLSDDLRDNVVKYFFTHLYLGKDIDLENERIAMLEVLERFSDFRNNLAHNAKIIDWELQINSEELAETFSLIIERRIFNKNTYKISFMIQIIQGIKKMRHNEILNEIEEYLLKKNKESKKEISKITKDIIKNNLNIEMK